MSASKDLIKIIREMGNKGTSPYDTEAEVIRVDNDTAWVHIAGGVDETPVTRTIDCKAGDTVQVRVTGGTAFLIGNATAPPTDDTKAKEAQAEVRKVSKVVKAVKAVADTASKIAGNTAQYFWHTESGTDTGVHITEIPREDFLDDPENGGANLLARSNGLAVRDGLTELATFGESLIEIGKNSKSAIIRFCGGKARLWATTATANQLTFALDDSLATETTKGMSLISHSESGSTSKTGNTWSRQSSTWVSSGISAEYVDDDTSSASVTVQANQNDDSQVSINGDDIRFNGRQLGVITAVLNANYTLRSTSYETSAFRQSNRIGDSLIMSGGKILCQQAGYVLVSGKAEIEGVNSGNVINAQIVKGASTVVVRATTRTGGERGSVAIPPFLVAVEGGDTLSLQFTNSSTTAGIVQSGNSRTFITAQFVIS